MFNESLRASPPKNQGVEAGCDSECHQICSFLDMMA